MTPINNPHIIVGKDASGKITREPGTYTKPKALRIADARNKYNRDDVEYWAEKVKK